MKRNIWIMLLLVMGLLLGGCRLENIGTSEPIEEEEEKVSENQLWHPIAQDKVECCQIAETFKAKVIDYGKDSLLLEFVQTATKNDAVVKLMKDEFKIIEVVRGGSVGIESISMMER